LADRPGSISSDESEASEGLLQGAAAVATAGGTGGDSSGDAGQPSEERGTSDYEAVQDDTTRAPWL